MKQIILGMLAHVDAGKTTLTESLLFSAGAIAKLGRVDHGTAFLDTEELEKNRGITIYSKEARFLYPEENAEVTLLDTPGHVDFSTEMERCLGVLDYGVLVISGSDGVQSHTETLWRLLRTHEIPCFIFVNKMDLPDLSQEKLMEDLRASLDPRCVNFSQQEGGEFQEQIALCDESLLEHFSGQFSREEITQAIWENKVFPCFFGSALKMEAVSEFLQDLMKYTCKKEQQNGAYGAKVFKITRDKKGTRLTHLKVTQGALAVRDVLDVQGNQEKINEIRLYSAKKYESVHSVSTGTICAVVGLQQSQGGQSLGVEPVQKPRVSAPILQYYLDLPQDIDVNQALPLLKQLQEEDPALAIDWVEEKQKIQVQLMGAVQLEVLSSVILLRFGFQVTFSERAIIYRETLAERQILEGVGHYEPLRHYAEVVLHLSPLPVDSGLQFECQCPREELGENYQKLVISHLKEGVLLGVLTGSPLTDLKITLVGGRAHQKHSQGGDFREATLRAVGQGLRQGKSVLLEPWYRVNLKLPTAHVGRAMADFQRMGGSCDISVTEEEFTLLQGEAPLSQMGNYGNSVQSYSGGRGQCSTQFLGYRSCQAAASVLAQQNYTPDMVGASVFCKHGAGYTVPWDQVHAHMHCHSRLEKEEAEILPTAVLRQHSQSYANSLAEDEALMAIFERTYGKISSEKMKKTEKSQVFSTAGAGKVKPYFLLVDGYNIIFAWEDLAKMAEDNLDSARQELINILCNYQGFYRCPVMVVFDAYRVKNGVGAVEKQHNITVVYTKEAETADMYIEKTTAHLASEYQVRVATSDRLEQVIILGQGGLRVSARGFYEEILQMNRAISAFLG